MIAKKGSGSHRACAVKHLMRSADFAKIFDEVEAQYTPFFEK